MTIESDILQFMTAMGQSNLTDDPVELERLINFRISLLDEEYEETIEALHWGDLRFIAKELVDLVYVAVGTAVALGIPFDEVFRAVHTSNMSKLDDEGNPYLREDGKVLKGPNYQPPEPKIEKILRS